MRTTDILERLIGFETVSHRSNLDLMAFVEDLLKESGFRTVRIPSPCGTKAGLYGEIGPQVERGLLLSAHTDVVPVDGQTWTRPPFRMTEDSGRFYGRGTTDMKGFIASALALARKAGQKDLTRPLALILSYDEEIGCVGLQQMLPDLAPLLKAPRLCIVGEPTEMRVATGHKGKIAHRAIFHGDAGHSALAPRFQNALHLAADFMADLRELQAELTEVGPFDHGYDIPHSTVHVGKLSGGTALNIVPVEAQMLFEIRYLATQDLGMLSRRLDAFLAKLNGEAGTTRAQMETINSYPGLDVDLELPEVKVLIDRTGQAPTKVAFGTEAGILTQLNITTLVCGPGSMEGQGHKADEYVHTNQLTACDTFLEQQMAEICGISPLSPNTP